MTNSRAISEHSRQELYDLVWSTPVEKLAAHFGISGVAVAKFCKRRNIPRPHRGYWAKVEAGHKPERVPLPLTDDPDFADFEKRRAPKTLMLPDNSASLVPLALELMKALAKSRLDDYQRKNLEEPSFPEVKVSKALSERVAKAFHVIVKEVEPLGIIFRKSRSKYSCGHFERKRDRLFLTISEDLIRSDGSKLQSEWGWPRENASPSGYLTFSCKTNRYGNPDTLQWSESSKISIEKTLAQVVTGLQKHYLELQSRREREKIEAARRHAEWLIQRAEWEKKEAVRLKAEIERNHALALAAAAETRKKLLLKAALNWRQSNSLLEFVAACEKQWKSQTTEPTPNQVAWLEWAREIAAAMSPFVSGYPEPLSDGGFDPSAIAVGGPYPQTRKFGGFPEVKQNETDP